MGGVVEVIGIIMLYYYISGTSPSRSATSRISIFGLVTGG